MPVTHPCKNDQKSVRPCNFFHKSITGSVFAILTISMCVSVWIMALNSYHYVFGSALLSQLNNSKEISIFLLVFSQVAGLLSNQLLVKSIRNESKALVQIGLLLFLGSIILFFLDERFVLYLILLLFFLSGHAIALAGLIFQKYIDQTQRILASGIVLIVNTIITFVLRSLPPIDHMAALFFINLLVAGCALILAVALNSCPKPEPNIRVLCVQKPEIRRAFLHLLIYIGAISFIKGVIFHSFSSHLIEVTPLCAIAIRIGYIVGIVAVTRFVGARHIGMSIYITNSIFLFALVCFISVNRSIWATMIFGSLICATFGFNDMFTFDTLFAFADKFDEPSNALNVGMSVHLFFVLFGQIMASYFGATMVLPVELMILIVYSIATIILPFIRLEISTLQVSSIFRVNPISASEQTEAFETAPMIPDREEIVREEESSSIARHDLLSQRENEVLDLILKGYPNEMIALELFISNNTLKKHIQSIYNKLGVHSRSELFVLMKKKP